MTTSCTKPIWIVVFKSEELPERTERILANDLNEVLSFYNEKGKNNIICIEKTKDEATYHY